MSTERDEIVTFLKDAVYKYRAHNPSKRDMVVVCKVSSDLAIHARNYEDALCVADFGRRAKNEIEAPFPDYVTRLWNDEWVLEDASLNPCTAVLDAITRVTTPEERALLEMQYRAYEQGNFYYD